MQNFAFLFTPMPAIIFLVPVLLIAIVLLVAINKMKTLDTTSTLPPVPPTTPDQVPVQNQVPVQTATSAAPVEVIQPIVQATEAPTPATIPVFSESIITPPPEEIIQGVAETSIPLVEVTKESIDHSAGQAATQSVETLNEPIIAQVPENIQPTEVTVVTEETKTTVEEGTQAVPVPVAEPVTISFRPEDPLPTSDVTEDRPFVSEIETPLSNLEIVQAINMQPNTEEVISQVVEYDANTTSVTESLDVYGIENLPAQSSTAPTSSPSSVLSPVTPRASSRLRPVL
jgi:hypothetical protein